MRKAWVLVVLGMGISSCGGGAKQLDPARTAQFVRSYADLLAANYRDVLRLAQSLRTAVGDFLTAASSGAADVSAKLEACKTAWLAARPAYLQTEMARFYAGPIDRDDDGVEGFVNAWPLDESYIDAVDGAPTAGIVNDPSGYPTLDASSLRTANEKDGETNISTGWHAIEFLLWGQDRSVGAGGGNRPATDFVDPGSGGTAPNADRRRQYLQLVTQMLVDDLTFLVDQWADGRTDNYRAQFLALAPAVALTRILRGLGTLAFAELRGERILVPFNTKDREDEHSCFSDTTHLDHLNDAIGIRNIWLGTYTSSDGSNNHIGLGLRELAAEVDAAQTARVGDVITAAIAALQGIPPPFETAILGDDQSPGRVAIQKVLDALADFNREMALLATRLGVTFDVSLE